LAKALGSIVSYQLSFANCSIQAELHTWWVFDVISDCVYLKMRGAFPA